MVVARRTGQVLLNLVLVVVLVGNFYHPDHLVYFRLVLLNHCKCCANDSFAHLRLVFVKPSFTCNRVGRSLKEK